MPSRPLPHPPRPSRRLTCALGLLGSGLLLWSATSTADSKTLLVVVNQSSPVAKLSASELRPIFQTSKRQWPNGTSIDAVNLPEQSPHRQVFDKAVLGFDPESAASYWIDRKIRGEARPPRKLATSAAVLAHVAATPGGIGYVPAGPLGTGVKLVARIVGGQVQAP